MDILILAAIAVYLFFKLRAQLGKIDEDQRRDAIRNFIKEKTQTDNQTNNNNQPALVAIPGVGIVEKPAENQEAIDFKSQKILDSLDPNLKSQLIPVLKTAHISADNFIIGANRAFEMIIEAFASGDLKTLNHLLSDKMYQQFESMIKDRQERNQFLNSKIFVIEKSEILSANMMGNFAVITVKFSSKQINYITNNGGEIIDGSKEELNHMIDVWTFKKDCNSTDPNWFVAQAVSD